MSDKITDDELANLLGVLCDFVQDSTQCFNPWPDEELKAVRELISDLKLGNRPRSVFANSVNLQTFQTPRYQLNQDQIENIMQDWENIPEDRRHSIESIINRSTEYHTCYMDLEMARKLYPLGILR